MTGLFPTTDAPPLLLAMTPPVPGGVAESLADANAREAGQVIPSLETGSEHAWKNDTSMVLMLAGTALLLLVLYRMLRRSWAHRRKHRNDRGMPPRDRIEALNETAERAARIDDGMAEAHEFTRRMVATLENKAARLEALLDRAEAVLERLERADPTGAQVGGQVGGQGGRASVAGDRESQRPRPIDASSEPDPLRRSVYRLADQGRNANEIAVELDQPVGQVELMLALRRRTSA